jgi:hypothetical protein
LMVSYSAFQKIFLKATSAVLKSNVVRKVTKKTTLKAVKTIARVG